MGVVQASDSVFAWKPLNVSIVVFGYVGEEALNHTIGPNFDRRISVLAIHKDRPREKARSRTGARCC